MIRNGVRFREQKNVVSNILINQFDWTIVYASHLSTKSTTLHSQLDTLLFACLKYFPNERNYNNNINSNNKTVFWCKLKRVSASNFRFDFHCKWIELLVWFCFSSSWFDFISAHHQWIVKQKKKWKEKKKLQKYATKSILCRMDRQRFNRTMSYLVFFLTNPILNASNIILSVFVGLM